MPETRYIKIEDGKGNIVEMRPYEVTDEQIQAEKDKKAMEKAEQMINNIATLAQAKVFLKKLCKRLFDNGALP